MQGFHVYMSKTKIIISGPSQDVLRKSDIETKDFHVNMGKTKIMVSGPGMDILRDSSKDQCTACLAGVSNKAITCSSCSCWVYKMCSGITDKVVLDPNFKCKCCRG